MKLRTSLRGAGPNERCAMPLRPLIVCLSYLVLWMGFGAFGVAVGPAPWVGPWYPGHALSLALVAVFGPAYLPMIFVARILAGLFLVSEPVSTTLIGALSIAAAYGVAGWILHSCRVDLRLGTMRAAAGFLAAGIGASILLPAIIGPALYLTGVVALPDLANRTFACMIGDSLSTIGLGPLVLRAALQWARLLKGARPDPRSEERVPAELMAGLAVATVAAIALSSRRWDLFGTAPLYLVALPVIWAAFVAGSAGAAWVVVAVNVGVPIVQQFAAYGLPLQDTQLLLGVVSVMGILLGAATTERRRHAADLDRQRVALEESMAATRRLCEVRSALDHAEAIAGIGSYRSDYKTHEVWWSDQLYRLLGREPGTFTPGADSFLQIIHPDDRAQLQETIVRIQAGVQPPGTILSMLRVIRGDGAVRHARISREICYGSDGALSHITGIVEDVTEEVETRRALADTEARLTAVAAHVPGMVFRYVKRAHGTNFGRGLGSFTYVSDGVRRLFGIEPETAMRRADLLFDRIHPDDRAAFDGAMRESARALTPCEVSFRATGPDGEIWVQGAAQPRGAPDGAVVWDGLLLDVTAEKCAERELRTSEERFRLMTALAPMALALIGRRDGKVRYANRACERMFGYSVGQMEGMRLSRLMVEPALARGMRRELDEAGVIMQREIGCRRQDGNRFNALFSIMRNGEPGDEEIVACGLDVSELKEARDALARQSHDLELRVRELHCRFVMARLTHDRSRGVEAICQDLIDLLPPGLAAGERLWVRLNVRGETFVTGTPGASPAQTTIRIRAGGEYIGDIEVGSLDGQVALPPASEPERDLLGSAGRQIGHMIFEREASARLVQAQRLESIGQLSGGIAHDFNNLLTVIFGNLELAEDQVKDDVSLAKCLANAQQAARRAAELTSQLLAFSRRQALSPEAVEMNELISRVVGPFRRTLGEAVEVVMELSAAPARVRVDPVQMETAILHLAVNARDAMAGSGRLTLATREIEVGADELEDRDEDAEVAPGPYVEVSISDTGGGMPPEVLGRVFDPFFTTKEVGQGTGLGLSAVFGFVKQSGGFLHVASEVGRGTTFRICLPLAEGVDERPTDDARPGTRDGATHEGACILVVEDEPQVLDYVARCLRLAGFRILTAHNAREALALLDSGCLPDLLLTDVGLPGGMDGPTLARAARDRDPGLKVLYASGYAYDTLVASGAIGGDVQVIFKPFVRHDLLVRVRAALDEEIAPVSPRAATATASPLTATPDRIQRCARPGFVSDRTPLLSCPRLTGERAHGN